MVELVDAVVAKGASRASAWTAFSRRRGWFEQDRPGHQHGRFNHPVIKVRLSELGLVQAASLGVVVRQPTPPPAPRRRAAAR